MAGSDSVKFNLSQMSKGEFDQFHAFVQACFDQGRQRVTPKLRAISNDIADMPEIHRGYLQTTSEIYALTMTTQGTRAETFDIYMIPQLLPGSFRFYLTLTHELVHGYAGLYCGHNAHWRRWLYRVLCHLDMAGMLPEHEDPVRLVCFSTGMGYTKGTSKQEVDLVKEVFTRAENEHTKVMDAYTERLLWTP